MAVVEYNVQNVGATPYEIAGVTVSPGQTRNLVEDGVTLEQISRSVSLAEGLAAGDLVGPPQTWWTTDANDNDLLVPGGVYFVADLTAPVSLRLPSAHLAVQVPLPIRVYNGTGFLVTLVVDPGDELFPAAPLVLSTEEHVDLWSTRNPVTDDWGYLAIR